MAITLGLSTALSGLLTSQKGLDVISQNVVNVNTVGYVRKVMTPESRILAGTGAGVQEGALVRSVDEGLLSDIRAQTSTQNALNTTQQYYPRIEDLFGKVGDATSISHKLESLQTGFETLSSNVTTAALQWGAVQSALDTTSQFASMTSQLQALRLEADRGINDTVSQVNNQLSNINDLNQKIVRNSAIGAETGNLEDKRDTALTTLAKYMDIQSFARSDGSVGVYTKTGKTLVDNTGASMTHSATTITDSWMTAAGGNFNPITLSSTPTPVDVSSDIQDGQLRALLNMRDSIIPNLQAQVDEAAAKLKDNINQIHNRGTSFPAMSSQMTGTRTLIDPNNPSVNGAAFAVATPALVPSPQKIWLSGSDDVNISLFDSTGTQVATTTLKTIMQSPAYNDAAGAATVLDISSTPATPGVKLTDVAAKIQNWMQAQSYQGNALSGARASISTGKFVLNTGNSGVSLAFRDQSATANGSTQSDARINFDVDGDGKSDQQVSGFSNFFGLNDFFVKKVPNSISDSNIIPANYTTSTTRTIRLLDPSGQVGNAISLSAGSSLESMAATINAQTQTTESSALTTTAVAISTTATISFSDSNGTIAGFPINLTSGAVSNLSDIANAINAVGGSVQAKIAQYGPNDYRLRVWDSRGKPLTTNVSGGTMGTSDLNTYLGLKKANLIQASVVPEGSGYRLRIRQTNDQELYVGATPDSMTPAGSLITDLGLHTAATRTAGNIDVRSEIKASAALVSRGAVQYNSDIGQYYLAEGDNTTALQLSRAMGDKAQMSAAGDIAAGTYSFSEYAAATISVVSTNASHAKDQLDYHTTLGKALDSQNASFSGVNLDEEVANMVNFQQAYSASAKVISTLQQMLDTLVSIIR